MFEQLKDILDESFCIFEEPLTYGFLDFKIETMEITNAQIARVDNCKIALEKQLAEDLAIKIMQKAINNPCDKGIPVMNNENYFDLPANGKMSVSHGAGVIIASREKEAPILVTDRGLCDNYQIRKDQKPALISANMDIEKHENGWTVSAMCKVAM